MEASPLFRVWIRRSNIPESPCVVENISLVFLFLLKITKALDLKGWAWSQRTLSGIP